MKNVSSYSAFCKLMRRTGILAYVLAAISAANYGVAQDTPLLSGGVGFFTSTSGTTSYQPHIEPLVSAPIGNSLLFESRGLILEEFAPNGNGGYSHSHLATVYYMQGDYVASSHLTAVAGYFLLPFNTYNDRLSEIWIENFQDSPLTSSLGTMNTGTGLGGMLSGSAASSSKYSVTYNAWFSARSGNFYFNSERSSGGRVSVYLPESRVEIGASYDRLLQQTRENFSGAYLWWEPKDTSFRFRSEYARGQHGDGYWVEADYRTQAFGGLDSWVGRFEPVFRMQESFAIDNLAGNDGVPSVNTKQPEFGLDYNLPHNTRILTSYSRELSSAGNANVWETGIVYRFLFPAWKSK